MQFDRLVDILIKEAKNEQPGRRYKQARESSGPAGITSSPVGRSDYNPQKYVPSKNRPADTKASSVRRTEKIIRNSLRIIKGNESFRRKLNNILKSYAKKKRYLSISQDSELSKAEAAMTKYNSKTTEYQNLLIKLDNANESNGEAYTSIHAKYEEALNRLKDAKERVSDIHDAIKDIISQNEQTSLEYQDEIVTLIQHIANKELEKLEKHIPEHSLTKTFHSFEELPTEIDDLEFDQIKLRAEHLKFLISDDEDQNPLFTYFYIQNQKYQAFKDSEVTFSRAKHSRYNEVIEKLWRMLPVTTFTSFYNATREDLPLRTLTPKRLKKLKTSQPIYQILDKIHDESDFETYRNDLLAVSQELPVDKGRKKAIEEIINGPYKKRGSTAVARLRGFLRGVLKENFDTVFLKILSKYDV